MARVIWSDQALEDIDNIANFIARGSLKYAKLQVIKFFKSTEVLETFPYIGRIVPECDIPEIREIIVDGTYRIVYNVVNSELVSVVAVHHSSKIINTVNIIKPQQ